MTVYNVLIRMVSLKLILIKFILVEKKLTLNLVHCHLMIRRQYALDHIPKQRKKEQVEKSFIKSISEGLPYTQEFV